MIDMQKFVNNLNEMDRRTRSQYHLTLGDLIEELEQAVANNSDASIWFDFGGTLGDEMSYRGYYSDLAFDYTNTATVRKCSKVLEQCRKALNTEYEGYKGGMYLMGEDTPLWVSAYGESSGYALVAVKTDDYGNVIIETKHIE